MAPLPSQGLHFGLGLLSIGRTWGVADVPPPSDEVAFELLQEAVRSGVRIFDTAPSYASSESRLGKHLSSLSPEERRSLTIMTKMGEHWNSEDQTAVVDHSIDALKRSIDRSLELLGHIDLLQVHKATATTVDHPEIRDAIDYARQQGIRHFGVSASSPDAAWRAIQSDLYCSIQFPFNQHSVQFEPLLDELRAERVVPITNRPFAMGHAIASGADPATGAENAFRFLTDHLVNGVVLSGTSKPMHLLENLTAFAQATGHL